MDGLLLFVFAGLRLNNAWASGTVLKPFLQPETRNPQWMVYSLVVRARGLEYGGREFKSRSLHLKPETELHEERGLSGCRKGLKIVPLAQALLSLKLSKNNKISKHSIKYVILYIYIAAYMTVFSDSIHIGSISPSKTIHFGPSVVKLA